MERKFKLLKVGVFVFGCVFGFVMIESMNFVDEIYFLYLYPIVLIIILLVINYYRYKDETISVIIFPVISLIQYIPVNFLAGVDLDGHFAYFGGFPRYEMIILYLIILAVLYTIINIVNTITKKKYTRHFYLLADILSLGALPFIAIVTYFVSPA